MVSDSPENEDLALSAAGYTPPLAGGTNQDVNTLIQEAVARALAQAQAQQVAASQPKQLSPEEEARAALDAAGRDKGVEERLNELYKVVELLAQKAGF